MKYMPKIDIPKYHVSEIERKSDYIVRMLFDYGVSNEREAVKIIEKNGVDKFNFDYPYGSFEEYKKHVLAGDFDVDIESHIVTPEHQAELDKAVSEGKLRMEKGILKTESLY